MLEYASGSSLRLPVVLQTSAGAPVTGVVAGNVTCSFMKSNGINYDAVLTVSTWVEFTGAAYINQGYYNIIAPVTYSSDQGIFQYCAKIAGANTYYGVVKVVAGDTSAIFNVIGSPFSGTVAAAIGATYQQAVIAAGNTGSGGSGGGSTTLVVQPGQTIVTARSIGAAVRVPVILLNISSGLPTTGVLGTAVTASVQKNDGTVYVLAVTDVIWTQVTASSFSGTGFYTLIIDGQYTNQAGYLAYAVQVSGSRAYYDVVPLGFSQDIAKVLGKPIQTIASDVIEVGKRVQRIDRKIK